MSRDQYLYRVRRPTEEELEFASKRFVHDCGLTDLDAERHPEHVGALRDAGLVAQATTYNTNTDDELIRHDFDVPDTAEQKSLAIRPDHTEYHWVTPDGEEHAAIIDDWDMEHRYTVVGSSVTDLIWSEKVGEWNDRYQFFEMTESGNVPVGGTCEEARLVHDIAKRHIVPIVNTAWSVCPDEMLEELASKGLVDADVTRDGHTYVYEEWW